MVPAGASQVEVEVEVEPSVLPAGAGIEVGGEPTVVAVQGAAAAAAVRVGRWSRGGTPSGTSEEHYWMELSQPSSSWFSCGCGWHHPRS
jgi:hypothetical protein